MKTIKRQVLASLLIVLVATGCEFDLPEAGSIPDVTFPEASFTADIGSNHRQIVFTNTTNDEAKGFIWDFGDGNSVEVGLDNRDTTYQYSTDGNFDVTLTAFDNNEVSSTSTVTLAIFDQTPPLANFDFAQLNSDFRVVSFSNLSQNTSTYLWDFGDGVGTSEDVEPVYTFNDAASGDEFDVTLRAIDELGDFADTTITISIVDDPTRPIANFSSETVGLTVFFTNESEMASSFVWDFGDGNSSTELSPAHRYEVPGRYEVSLSAISDDNRVTTLTKAVIADRFVPIIANGTFDDYTGINNGDNIDPWDMTPNSTISDLNGGPDIPSPFQALWNNTALNDYIDVTYCTDEQPANTSNGVYDGDVRTRAAKLEDPCRRLYQVVEVIAGDEYTLSLQSRSEVEGIETEVFILNSEITTEVDIDADLSTSNPLIDGYLVITNDFNSSSGSPDNNTFTRNLLTFTASSDQIVIYIRALGAIDSMNEVFIDNITIN
ncbi:MAG: PKD domain-containing protein [Bacteroidota bacterium]